MCMWSEVAKSRGRESSKSAVKQQELLDFLIIIINERIRQDSRTEEKAKSAEGCFTTRKRAS